MKQAGGGLNKDSSANKAKKILNNQQILSDTQKNEIKMAFDFFDITGSGTIEAKNLKVVLRALGFDPTNEEIDKLIKDLGRDDRADAKKIDFQEFLEIMIVKMSQKDTPEDIDKAFSLFVDPKQKNVVTFDSLKQVIDDLEEDLSEEEIFELILGANIKIMEKLNAKDDQGTGNKKAPEITMKDKNNIHVTKEQFIKILTRDINDDKKKAPV
eukprot:TRINITY_DN1058_c0_g1_i2.p1 TRINITY_DN1058_c0_g1~~TRINITY_DN1058_c0_g1_i2.p1  ORF type:complete len:212 (+),score=73.51 TRINITY_DN1058_c0_g1_i2:114-749(+)